MKRKLAAVVLCGAMLGIAGGQPPAPGDGPPPAISNVVPSLPVAGNGQAVDPLPSIPGIALSNDQATSLPRIENPAPPAAPVPPNFDALVKELQSVRTQKAELEKREKAITEALLKKFAEQKSQLEKLGIPVTPPAAPAPVSEVSFDSPPILAPAPKGGSGTPVK
jgi:hypothetical protein